MAAGPSSLDAAAPRLSKQGELAQGLVVLALVGPSIVLTAYQLRLPTDKVLAFLFKNELAPEMRMGLLARLLSAAILLPGLALLAIGIRRKDSSELATRIAWLSSPLALAWALPNLLAYKTWYEQPTQYLIFLALIVLGFEWLLTRSCEAAGAPSLTFAHAGAANAAERIRAWLPVVVVVCGAAAYAGATGWFSIVQHQRFATGAYDLGIYDNLIFNNMHGHFFHCPILKEGVNYLSNHAEFGTLFVVPLYALKPGPELLLALQAVCIGGAAIPLYLFASTQLSRGASAAIALAYLLFAPIHGASFYDFHWIPVTMPLWFTLFYAVARRKSWWIAATVVVLLPIREETGVMLAVLGLFLLLTSYWARLGITFVIVGGLWFVAMRFVVMPLAGSWWFDNMYADLIPPGEHGFGGVVRTLLSNPAYVWKTLSTEAKLTYALQLFAPLAFLPLRRPALTLLALPGAFFTLLTTSYAATLSIRFQYPTHWVPWLFAASVLMLRIRGHEQGVFAQRGSLGALLIGVVLHSYVFGALLQHETFISGFNRITFAPLNPEEQKRFTTFERMRRQIPAKASVAATDAEAAHIATRLKAFSLRIADGDVDYLLLRGSSVGGETRRNAQAILNRHEYVLVDLGEDLYLLRRGTPTSYTNVVLHRFHLQQKGERKHK